MSDFDNASELASDEVAVTLGTSRKPPFSTDDLETLWQPASASGINVIAAVSFNVFQSIEGASSRWEEKNSGWDARDSSVEKARSIPNQADSARSFSTIALSSLFSV